MPESSRDWSRLEVETIVADYLDMLERELRGEPYNKSEHRRGLESLLDDRSEGSIEYKHQNISAVMLELGQPYIEGYKPQGNYQQLLFDVIEDRLDRSRELLKTVENQVEAESDIPSVDDILDRLVDAPTSPDPDRLRYVRQAPRGRGSVPNYLLREARNASLGRAGEAFVINFERARLLRERRDELAADVEHVAVTRGDHEGFDVLSFDADGRERLIEVKTTAFGEMTPFFVSPNQVELSEREQRRFHLYRLFRFRKDPRLFSVPGAIRSRFDLEASEYTARLA